MALKRKQTGRVEEKPQQELELSSSPSTSSSPGLASTASRNKRTRLSTEGGGKGQQPKEEEMANTQLFALINPPSSLSSSSPSPGTPFERRVWSLLLQIPPGSVSTYALLAAHLSSSPRAVGNALRRNPYAPQVPCHRVVATGGRLGGFKGQIAGKAAAAGLKGRGRGKNGNNDDEAGNLLLRKEGITLEEKRSLLRGEGVKIDGTGKVLGTPWGNFT